MKSKQDDFGYWMGWFVAFGIAASFLIYVVWQGPTLRNAMCKADEADCFRQWVTALGGWGAIVVAVPSILYLARQVKDADTQYRITTTLDVRRLRALSNHMISHTEKVDRITTEKSEKFRRYFSEKKLRYWEVVQEIKIIESLLEESHFLNFESEIFTPENSVSTVRSSIRFATEVFVDYPKGEIVNKGDMELAVQILRIIREYAASVKEQAVIYLHDTDRFDMRKL